MRKRPLSHRGSPFFIHHSSFLFLHLHWHPMSLLIDGYNLIHAAGLVGQGRGPGGLERSRLALLNFLAQSLAAADLARTTVVFDAAGVRRGCRIRWRIAA